MNARVPTRFRRSGDLSVRSPAQTATRGRSCAWDLRNFGQTHLAHSTHRRLRRLAEPAFHPTRLPGYAQAMTACIQEITDSWQAGQVLDILMEMMAITSQVTVTTLFSTALPPAELKQLRNDVETIFDGIFQRMLMISPLDRLPTPANASS